MVAILMTTYAIEGFLATTMSVQSVCLFFLFFSHLTWKCSKLSWLSTCNGIISICCETRLSDWDRTFPIDAKYLQFFAIFANLVNRSNRINRARRATTNDVAEKPDKRDRRRKTTSEATTKKSTKFNIYFHWQTAHKMDVHGCFKCPAFGARRLIVRFLRCLPLHACRSAFPNHSNKRKSITCQRSCGIRRASWIPRRKKRH